MHQVGRAIYGVQFVVGSAEAGAFACAVAGAFACAGAGAGAVHIIHFAVCSQCAVSCHI